MSRTFLSDMNYKKVETAKTNIESEYESLYRIVLTLSRKCNYKCSFCPQSNANISKKFKAGFLSLKTVEKLIENLDGKFSGTFSLSGFGEPTLNPDFFNIILKLKNETCAKVDVISNGSNINKLLECKADTIHISAYNPNLEEKLIKATLEDDRVTVLQKYKCDNFNNRGGNLYNIKQSLNTSCNILFMKLSIDYNGDILKCCSDWTKKDILGNVYKDSIWDIWFNKTQEDKINMINGMRNEILICKNCNAVGNLYGNQFKDFWIKYYEKN